VDIASSSPLAHEAAVVRVPRALRFAERAMRDVTWQGMTAVVVFSALDGANLGVAGVAGTLALFVPAYLAGALAAPFAPKRMVPRAAVLALAVTMGVALGYVVSGVAHDGMVSWRGGGARHAMAALPVLVMAWLGLAILLLHERERDAAQAVHEEAERRIDLERRVSEARLRVLQSQIEPHFLFNTLAHVRRLCRTSPPAGRAMMRDLAHYVGAAQAALQNASIPLAADVGLAVAYLNIQQIRMRERLRFAVDVPPDCAQAHVPPMTLTTLVENAVKHGLSPLAEGGGVTIAARAHGDTIVVEVSDTGRGFRSTLGAGVGLANIRSRLAIVHGASASLALSMNVPNGVIVTLVVPAGDPAVRVP
jgi:signal transduction histidine kinase